MNTSPATAPAAGTPSAGATMIADVLAILVFAILARLAHNTPEDPFTLVNVLDTWWPFLLGVVAGWGIAVALKQHVRPVRWGGVIVWLSAAVIGLGIWGIRHAAFPHWSFIIVATVMGAVVLLGWRAIAAAVARRR
ncbi:DUF3054 domain-containing protein [Corynebacterium sp. 335C]